MCGKPANCMPPGATHVTQRIGEKHLAVESPEGGVALEEQHPRIAQHGGSITAMCGKPANCMPPGATHVTQRIGEKHLAVESPEGGVALEEQHPRIAQHGGSGLHPALLG